MIQQTKIVCTLGPASCTPETIASLAEEGMNVARINMSHGNKEQYKQFIDIVREINVHLTIPIGIMLDTKGAEIRTGERENPLVIAKKETVRFCPPGTLSQYTDTACIEVSYDGFAEDCKETKKLLVDNGELSFTILSIEDDGTVLASANQAGSIGSRRHINLFGALVDLPTITEKDWEDLAFAVEQNVDFIALSFIRTAKDVSDVRQFLQKHKSSMHIIAKIETRQAVDNIHSIITASDSIMIARGDLGAEIPYEQIPTVQDRIVTMCSDEKKPVIVATQMLESMKEHPMPTRAEITDVAHAAMTQADATMLSAETASGNHPALAVSAMAKILQYTEQNLLHSRVALRRLHEQDTLDVVSAEICKEAYRQRVDCIVLETTSYEKILSLSKQRPEVSVFHLSDSDSLARKCSLVYGTHSMYSAETSQSERLNALKTAGKFTQPITVLIVQWGSDIPSYSTVTI